MQPAILKATVLCNDGQFHFIKISEPYDSEKSMAAYIDHFEKLAYEKTKAPVVIVIYLERTLHDEDGNYVLTDDAEIYFEEIYVV